MTAMAAVPPAMATSEIAGHAGTAKVSTCRPSPRETAADPAAATEPTTVAATGREPAATATVGLGGARCRREGC